MTLPPLIPGDRLQVQALTQSQWTAGDTGAIVASGWVALDASQLALEVPDALALVGQMPTITAIWESSSGRSFTGTAYGSPDWQVTPSGAVVTPVPGTDQAQFLAMVPGTYTVVARWDGQTATTTVTAKAFTPPFPIDASGLTMSAREVIPPAVGEPPVIVTVASPPIVINNADNVMPDEGYYTLQGPAGASGVSLDAQTGAVTVNPGATEGRYIIGYAQGRAYTSTTLTVTAGPVSRVNSTVSVPDTPVSAGSAFTVSGTLRDANGNPVVNESVTVQFDGQTATQITGNQGQFQLVVHPTEAVTNSPVTVLAGSGSSTVVSQLGDVGSVVAGSPDQVLSSGPPAAVIAAGNQDVLTFTFKDAYGNPVIDQAVTWGSAGLSDARYALLTAPSVSQPLNDLPAVTNASGQVSLIMNDTKAGESGQIVASVDGITEESGIQTVIAGPIAPAESTVTLPSGPVVAGTSLPISGVLRDQYGNPISGSSVTVAFDGLSDTVTTNASGLFAAALRPTVAVNSGPVTVSAASGVTLSNSHDQLSVIAGPANPQHSTVVLSSAVIDAGIPFIVSGTAEDQFGNAINGEPVTVSFDGETASGIVTSGRYAVDLIPTAIVTGGTIAVAIGSGSGVSISSGLVASVVVGPASARKTTFALSSSTVQAGAPLTIQGVAEDAAGLKIVGQSVEVAFDGVTSTGTTDTNGDFAVSVEPHSVVQDAPVTVSVGSVTVSSGQTASVQPGPVSAAESQVSISTASLELGGTLTVSGIVEDSYNNPVGSAPVTVTWAGVSANTKTTASGTFVANLVPRQVVGTSPVVVSAGTGSTVISSGLSAAVVDTPDPSLSTVSVPTAASSAGGCVSTGIATYTLEVSGDVFDSYGVAVDGAPAVVSADGALASALTSAGRFQVELYLCAGMSGPTTFGTHSIWVKVDGVTLYTGDIGVGTAAPSGSGSGGTPGLF